MLRIRKNVFETNSSSSHSITIPHPNELNWNEMDINEDGYIEVSLGKFCHGDHESQNDRLAWLIQLIVNEKLSYNAFWYYRDKDEWETLAEQLYATEEFQELEAEIADYADCSGIRLSPRTEGYIDHSSNYDSMKSFLLEYDVSAVSFVFGEGVVMNFEFIG